MRSLIVVAAAAVLATSGILSVVGQSTNCQAACNSFVNLNSGCNDNACRCSLQMLNAIRACGACDPAAFGGNIDTFLNQRQLACARTAVSFSSIASPVVITSSKPTIAAVPTLSTPRITVVVNTPTTYLSIASDPSDVNDAGIASNAAGNAQNTPADAVTLNTVAPVAATSVSVIPLSIAVTPLLSTSASILGINNGVAGANLNPFSPASTSTNASAPSVIFSSMAVKMAAIILASVLFV